MNETQLNQERRAFLKNKINACETISELFSIVRDEHIDIRMQTLCSASNIPPKMFNHDPDSLEPAFERLRKLVLLAIENNI